MSLAATGYAGLRLSARTISRSRSFIKTFERAASSRIYSAQSKYPSLSAKRSFYISTKKWQQAAAIREDTSDENDGNQGGQITRFDELARRGLVAKPVIDTITRSMKLETMTPVQALTINEALTGVDILAQAKTGTGKTIGFLLPVIQNILSHDPSLLKKGYPKRPRYGRGSDSTLALIISPTRELAEQIAVEARRLTENTGLLVQTAVGGTQKNFHLQKMQKEGCHLLVGTPGRIKDLFSDEGHTGISAPDLRSFVLDEADRLMDQGFWPEIEDIQSYLPNRKEQDRQTMLFSATMPREIVQMARSTLKKDMHYVRTVAEDDTPTIDRVKQHLVELPGMENALPAVLEIFERVVTASENDPTPKPFKAILYLNSTAEVALVSSLLRELKDNRHLLPPSLQRIFSDRNLSPFITSIHSRLTQQGRTRAAELFRNSRTAILCSSDVTARGMDFPGVTHVIQIGLPATLESYIHRLGRTARAGREGEGWLLVPRLARREANYRHRGLPITPLPQEEELSSTQVDTSRLPQEAAEDPEYKLPNQYMESVLAAARSVMERERVPSDTFNKAYMGMLGTLQWLPDKRGMIDMMNRVSRWGWGQMRPPSMGPTLATKLGLRGVPGLQMSRGESYGNKDSGDFGSGGIRRTSGGGFGDRGRSSSFGDRGRSSSPFGGNRDRSSGFGDRERSSGFGDRNRSSGFGDRGRSSGGFGDRRGGDRQQRPWEGRGTTSARHQKRY